MKRMIPAIIAAFLLLPSLSAGLEISSVYPNPAIIDAPVTIIGGPFSLLVKVIIGGQEIIPNRVEERQLVFIVPQLEAGEHTLYLIDHQQKSEQQISLRISLPAPLISSLEPSNIDECSTENERVVTLTGNHFQQSAQLLLDGKIVPATRVSETEINMTVPPLKAGTYGVQVVNPDGNKSLPHSLWLNDIPHIYNVSIGEDDISSYQLIINGKNFAHNSSLIVYEYPVGVLDLKPQQQIVPSQGGGAFRGEQARLQQSAAVTYIDCNTLIYNRYPYSRQDKRLMLRIGNPDGKQTESFEVSAP